MAERSNAAVLKTVVLLPWDRGFKSLFLRRANATLAKAGVFCFYSSPSRVYMSEERYENKKGINPKNLGIIKWLKEAFIAWYTLLLNTSKKIILWSFRAACFLPRSGYCIVENCTKTFFIPCRGYGFLFSPYDKKPYTSGWYDTVSPTGNKCSLACWQLQYRMPCGQRTNTGATIYFLGNCLIWPIRDYSLQKKSML